jgi:hypothetical protein
MERLKIIEIVDKNRILNIKKDTIDLSLTKLGGVLNKK